MNFGKGIIGALIGAAIGAAIWAGIGALFKLEVGYVALVVGALVGIGAAYMGGSGAAMGATCAVLALVAIFVGKMLAVHFLIANDLDKMVNEEATSSVYEEVKRDAEDIQKATTDQQIAEFMVSHNYADGITDPKQLSPEDIEEFKRHDLPNLNSVRMNQPSFEKWRDQQRMRFQDHYSREVSLSGIVTDDLDGIDIIFGLLGLATAFKVGSGRQD